MDNNLLCTSVLNSSEGRNYSLMPFFVYGTMRHFAHNHKRLQNAVYIGSGRTDEKMYLSYDRHSKIPHAGQIFNFMNFVDEERYQTNVLGELYLVPLVDVPSIDALEGHPTWYERRLTTINAELLLTEGESTQFAKIEAWMYHFDIVSFNGKHHGLIQTGNYEPIYSNINGY